MELTLQDQYSYKKINKKHLKRHVGLCFAKICYKTLKESEITFITPSTITKWEKQLEKCNKCYLEQGNHSYLNTVTRGVVSADVHQYNQKNGRNRLRNGYL